MSGNSEQGSYQTTKNFDRVFEAEKGLMRSSPEHEDVASEERTNVAHADSMVRKASTRASATKVQEGKKADDTLFSHVYAGNLAGVEKFIMTNSSKAVAEALARKHQVFSQTPLERALLEARLYRDVDGADEKVNIYTTLFVAHNYGLRASQERISSGNRTMPAAAEFELSVAQPAQQYEPDTAQKLAVVVATVQDAAAEAYGNASKAAAHAAAWTKRAVVNSGALDKMADALESFARALRGGRGRGSIA